MALFQTTVQIENELGLHARAAAILVQRANKFRCRITLEKNGQRVNGKSIMGVMMLAAGKGSNLIITARGVDAERAVRALEELIEDKFGED